MLVEEEEVVVEASVITSLSRGTTDRGSLATTGTSIGPHPGRLNGVTCTMSIYQGVEK